MEETSLRPAFTSLHAYLLEHERLAISPRILQAMRAAEEAYRGKTHWSGLPMLDFVSGVLNELLRFQPDEDAIVACLLHQVLCARDWTLDDVSDEFGDGIRSIIAGVHLLDHVTMENRHLSPENLRLMLLRVSDDVRVILIVLCKESFLMTLMGSMRPEQRRKLCSDVLHLYAPVAARLGIYALKHSLESKAFPVVYPVDAERINEQLKGLHATHGFFLDGAARSLQRFLAENGIRAVIEGREKQAYSIFKKMHD